MGSKDIKGGVLTIQGGSMVDYFNNKANLSINQLKGTSGTFNKLNSSDSEGEQRVGFEFSEKSNDFTFDNPCLNVSDGAVETKTETESCDFVFDNPCLDLSDDKEIRDSPKAKVKKKKKSNFYIREEDLNSSNGNSEQKLDLVSIDGEKLNRPKKLKKSKKNKNNETGLDNLALDDNILDESSRPSRKRKRDFVYTGHEPVIQPIMEPITPNRVKKVKNGISNNALDLSFPDQETDQSSKFEVSRTQNYETLRISTKGIENTALTLSDSEEEKKSEKKKKKKKDNLDKYEVVTDKLKRKHAQASESQGIVNEALQDEDANTEQLQNEANERKSRKRRRKERRVSTLETIIEVSEDEADRSQEKIKETPEVQIVSEFVGIIHESGSVSKKKKKKKKVDKENSDSVDNNEELTMEEFLSELNKKASPKSSPHKKPKHVLQALFKKNPTPVFNGSNIHEIKGYGAQFYS